MKHPWVVWQITHNPRELKLMISSIIAANPWTSCLSETGEMKRRNARTHLSPRLASNSHLHSHLWGSYSRELEILPVEVFLRSHVGVDSWRYVLWVSSLLLELKLMATFGYKLNAQPSLLAFPLSLHGVHSPLWPWPQRFLHSSLQVGGEEHLLRAFFLYSVHFFCSHKPDFYLGCFVGHQWIHFIAAIGELILLLCH